ncbi:carbohydrate kinase family protein [Virgibacillus sp. W0430]|uniref:carbohydrate kinase family protein n=1 Tax=Virgibacillus sp. W0430 TaxID=3391580 RepID=UPI003F44D66E
MDKQGVICLGEALVDMIPTNTENTLYRKSAGGAPANVAVGVAKLGERSTFIGKVGDDSLGRFLQHTLKHYGVVVEHMQFTSKARTGIAIVTNAGDGERSFEFFVKPSADQFLQAKEIHKKILVSHRILHVGSISMITPAAKKATEYAVKHAKENKMLLSYDPNLRLDLWKNANSARETITSMLSKVDVVKLSKEELQFITGVYSIEKGLERLEKYELPLLFITLGAEGCYVCTKEGYAHVPSARVKAVDTTGAGDGFMAGIIYSIIKGHKSVNNVSIEDAIKMARLAVVAGALTASKKGTMAALPTISDIEGFNN